MVGNKSSNSPVNKKGATHMVVDNPKNLRRIQDPRRQKDQEFKRQISYCERNPDAEP